VSILILRGETPLERYLLHYPAVYQTPWLQALSLAPRNSQVAQQHLLCAAAELALGAGERYVSMPGIRPLLQHLASTNAIAHRGVSGEWTTTQRQPHRGVRLRAYEPAFALINQYDGQLLTTVAPAQAFRDCFEGAIYHHNGRTFHVERVHTERRRILVRPIQATYLTQGMVKVSITEQRLEAAVSKDIWHLAYGSLTYTETLHAFERLDAQTHRRLSLHVLSASQRQVQTQGVWCEFAAPGARYRVPERVAVHTLVHAILAGLPLLLANNPGRIHGGVHERAPAGPGWRAVFSDADAGGNGVSAFIYGAHEQVWRAGLHVLLHCSCDHGCPRCIAAQPCITCASESTLDRGAGIALLQSLLEEVVPPLEHVRFPGTSSAAEPGTQDTHVPRHLYLCLTTQKSAEEVGGWQHKHLLELGMAVTYNTSDGQYRVYTAETVEALLASLCQADLVIGFNLRDFDYQVLQPCTDTPLATLPTLAILDDIQQGLGFRLSLSHVVHETLGIDRPDDSLQTLHWFRQGEQDRIIQHCRRDVELIRALVQHGATTGSLWYRDHTGERRALPVPWQSAEQHGQSAVQYYLPRNRQPSGTPKG
jgi:DEAD/DEAH box helicase domain-containing protein